MARSMNLVLNVWRQKSPKEPGGFVRYEAKAINDHMSFLEMLDVVNEGLAQKGEAPIAFDHDCREGICGACGMVAGLIHDIPTVKELIDRIMMEAEQLIRSRLTGFLDADTASKKVV